MYVCTAIMVDLEELNFKLAFAKNSYEIQEITERIHNIHVSLMHGPDLPPTFADLLISSE